CHKRSECEPHRAKQVNRCLARLLNCAFRGFNQTRECSRILDRQFRQNFSIHIYACGLQSGDELVVVQAILSRCSADTDDPQAEEFTLAHFSIAISVDESLFDRLLRKFVQLALIKVVALGKTEKLLTAIMPLGSTFNSRQFESPYDCRRIL